MSASGIFALSAGTTIQSGRWTPRTGSTAIVKPKAVLTRDFTPTTVT